MALTTASPIAASKTSCERDLNHARLLASESRQHQTAIEIMRENDPPLIGSEIEDFGIACSGMSYLRPMNSFDAGFAPPSVARCVISAATQ